jgi:hypothetical protein
MMLIEMRTYTLKPGSAASYLQLYEDKGLTVHRRILGNLLGYFSTEVGAINQVVHLWGYDSFEERQRRRAELSKNAEWQQFLQLALPYFVDQQTQFLNGTRFSPIR